MSIKFASLPYVLIKFTWVSFVGEYHKLIQMFTVTTGEQFVIECDVTDSKL